MGHYLKPIPPHSGLTALQGGDASTGEYYHFAQSQHDYLAGLYSGVTAVSATTLYSGSTNLSHLLGQAATYIQPGTNAYTGGTASRPIIGIIGSPSFTSVTATSFISGSTNINDLIASSLGGNGSADDGLLVRFNSEGQLRASVENSTTPAIWASALGTQTAMYVNGSNLSDLVYFQQSGNGNALAALSTGGYGIVAHSSNATPLLVNSIDFGGSRSDIAKFTTGLTPSLQLSVLFDGALIWSSATGAARTRTFLGVPFVQPGNQITTGGTVIAPTINLVGSPRFTNLNVSGVTYGATVSGDTYYSGSTPLNTILSTYGPSTYVQPGNQITTGGTQNAPTINLVGSPRLTNLNVSGVTYGATVSGDTYYSGSTPLMTQVTNVTNSLYAPISVQNQWVQPGSNITTGGTVNAPVVSVVDSPSFVSVTAKNFISGSTNLNDLFYPPTSSTEKTFRQVVIQTSHRFSEGDIIVSSGTFDEYSLADISLLGGSDIVGMVVEVLDGNRFILASEGYVQYRVFSLVAGTVYYLDKTQPGKLTSTFPPLDSDYVKPVFIGVSETYGYLLNATDVKTGIGRSISLASSAGAAANAIGLGVSYDVTFNSVNAASVSAATFYSGSTNLNYLLGQLATPATYVQPGLNITTGGTATAPIVNLAGSIGLTGITFSSFIRDQSGNVAEGVYYRDSTTGWLTNSNLFYYIPSLGQLQLTAGDDAGLYTNGGITGTTINGSVFNIDGADVNTLFAPISVVNRYVQPGSNITTGGTAIAPVVSVVGSPIFTAVTAASISGTSVSATTFYSGSTNLNHLLGGTTTQLSSGGISFSMDGGSSVISTGQKGYIIAPYSGTITSWTIISHETGDIVVDVWKAPYASFPPTVSDTIAGSEKPTLSSSNKNQDNNLTTWTTSFDSGDIFTINVDSVSTVKKVTLILNVTKLS